MRVLPRAAALIILAASVGLSAAKSARAQVEDSAGAVHVPVARTVPVRLTTLEVPIHPRVAPAPNGDRFAAIQVRPRPVLWIVPTGGGEPFSFREMWAAYHARWSPAGQRIGFIAAIGPPRIWTVEVDSTSGRPMAPPRMLIRTGANAFAFAPDGETIALVASRSTAAGASAIHLVDWASRRYRVLLSEEGVIYRLDWAPTGGHIYYGLLPEDGEAGDVHRIVRADVRNGARMTVRISGEFLGLAPDGSRLLYRPREKWDSEREVVEIAPLDDGSPFRLTLPADAGEPYWSADSNALLTVRAQPAGDEVWEIPLPPQPSTSAR